MTARLLVAAGGGLLAPGTLGATGVLDFALPRHAGTGFHGFELRPVTRRSPAGTRGASFANRNGSTAILEPDQCLALLSARIPAFVCRAFLSLGFGCVISGPAGSAGFRAECHRAVINLRQRLA